MFTDIPSYIFDSISLNLTFDGSNTQNGIRTSSETCSFNGIIGSLQRNETDFTPLPIPLQVLIGNTCTNNTGSDGLPVQVIDFMHMMQSVIVSYPVYNRSESEIRSNLEGSLNVVSIGVIAFYACVTLFLHSSIITFQRFLSDLKLKGRRKGEREGSQKLKPARRNRSLAWCMIRYYLCQGSWIDFDSKTQKVLLYTFEIAIGILIALFFNFIHVEMVTYAKPYLIDTLHELYSARDVFNISFGEFQGSARTFSNYPIESLERKIWEESKIQWETVERKHAGPNLQTLANDRLMELNSIIKRYRMAVLSFEMNAEIMMQLDCCRESAPDDTFGTFYMSRQSFMNDVAVLVSRHGISSELVHRLRLYSKKWAESGFLQLMLSKGADITLDNIPLPGAFISQTCLNVKAWSDEHTNTEDSNVLTFEHFISFYLHISFLFVFVSISFGYEYFFAQYKAREYSSVRAKKESDSVRRKLLRRRILRAGTCYNELFAAKKSGSN